MLFSFFSAIIALTFFLGVLALQQRKSQLNAGRSAYQIYQSFFASFAAYFALLTGANVLPISHDVAQLALYLGLYVFLFVGLAFCLRFTIQIGGHPIVANTVFSAVSMLGIVMFLYRLTNLPIPQVHTVGALFLYRNPNYTAGEILLTTIGIVITAAVFAVAFFRTGKSALVVAIRKRSYFMAAGAMVAAAGGVGYFTSHLFSVAYVPYIATGSLVPAVIGFALMVYPLLSHHDNNE